MAIQQWTWANFYQGISEDRHFGAEKGFFQANYGVDTQIEPRGVRLHNVEQSQYTFVARDVKLVQRLEDWFSNQSGFIHVVDQKFYKNGTLVGLLSSGVTGWQKSSISSGAYILFFGTSTIDVYNIASNTLTLNIGSISSGSTARPSISMTFADGSGGTIYVGVGNTVKKILHTGATTVAVSDILTVGIGEEIAGITRYNTEYRVYTKAGQSGRQYMWDGASSNPSSFVDWNNTPIQSVASAGAVDYVIAGISSEFYDLWLATGTERKLVRTGRAGGRGRLFTSRMAVCKDVVYIVGAMDMARNGETSERRTCIFSYGNENSGFPKGLQIEYVWNDEEDVEVEYCNVYPIEDRIYIGKGYQNAIPASYQVWTEKRKRPTTNYVSDGELISNTFSGGVYWAVKDIKQINIGYSLEEALGYGGSIEVYCRVKSYGTWTLLDTITDSSINFHKIFENQITNAKFNEMEIKVKLIGDEDKTPLLYEVTVIYDDNLRA